MIFEIFLLTCGSGKMRRILLFENDYQTNTFAASLTVVLPLLSAQIAATVFIPTWFGYWLQWLVFLMTQLTSKALLT